MALFMVSEEGDIYCFIVIQWQFCDKASKKMFCYSYNNDTFFFTEHDGPVVTIKV